MKDITFGVVLGVGGTLILLQLLVMFFPQKEEPKQKSPNIYVSVSVQKPSEILPTLQAIGKGLPGLQGSGYWK